MTNVKIYKNLKINIIYSKIEPTPLVKKAQKGHFGPIVKILKLKVLAFN
jgi:hypothetical protein